jgi:hypothetical protein
MKPRHIVLAVAAVLIVLAVRLAWWSGPAESHLPSSSRSARSAPVVTQTGEVIPAANVSTASSAPVPDASVAAVAAQSTLSAQSASGAPTPSPRIGAPATQFTVGAGTPVRAAALVEANKVRHMITDYHTLMGQNPVGTNAEIMQAVMGGNARQAVLGPPVGQSLNGRGELIDQWGTPYFFHQLSGDRMEIHSAGPDRIMGTADDIVVR